MCVVKSYINNRNESTRQFIDSFADDESLHVVARTGYKKKFKNADSDVHATRMGVMDDELEPSNKIVGVEVDWVLSDEMENQLYDTVNWNEFKKMKHGEWHEL